MVHEIFKNLAREPYLADECARNAIQVKKPGLKFTKVFSVFYPSDGHVDSNVKSWLNLISKTFHFDKKRLSGASAWEVEKLFRRFGYTPTAPENKGAFSFMLYLVWIYEKLEESGYDRNDNIFKFMSGCSFEDVNVQKDIPSSGHAFHDSVCPSTTKILDFLNYETNKLCKHAQDYWQLKIFWKVLRGAKYNCNLFGWIEQGVLLLNARLTVEKHMEEAWGLLTHFLIERLNEKRHAAFIFLGRTVTDYALLVDKNRHFVMNLYHPSTYTYANHSVGNKDLDWKTNLPFINVNYYLHQVGKKPIDWTSIGWKRSQRGTRMRDWTNLFNRLHEAARWKTDTFQFAGCFYSVPAHGFWRLQFCPRN
ncbi:Uracil-DNA glycosylase [Orchesella cincta]|uniref:Uracil-DNA glycosylase n=1 Tax=Orchesella cincta TaxID=48709 RepID=A0A1D2NIF8_ORCCI|nr:Uracil-DNA glycosylase [Orchesella cincta]